MLSVTGYCRAWGARAGARRVYGLAPDERAAVRDGALVTIAGCPLVKGATTRRVILSHGRFYARLP